MATRERRGGPEKDPVLVGRESKNQGLDLIRVLLIVESWGRAWR